MSHPSLGKNCQLRNQLMILRAIATWEEKCEFLHYFPANCFIFQLSIIINVYDKKIFLGVRNKLFVARYLFFEHLKADSTLITYRRKYKLGKVENEIKFPLPKLCYRLH